jgi:hypothetical protein
LRSISFKKNWCLVTVYLNINYLITSHNYQAKIQMSSNGFLVETSTTKMKPKVPKMLEDCSNEVLTEIFSHLCKKDIFSCVALVCIRFCELTKSPKLMPKCVEIVRSKSDRQINSILDMLRINTHLETVRMKKKKKKSNLNLNLKLKLWFFFLSLRK